MSEIFDDEMLELVRKKNAEIAALREALDAVRWDKFRGGMGGRACIECGLMEAEPETHTPTCKIGKLFAGKQ